MTCNEYEELLSAFVDGQLDTEEKLFIEAHLSRCRNCARLLNEVKSVKLSLSRMPRRELPELFLPDLREKLGFANRRTEEKKHAGLFVLQRFAHVPAMRRILIPTLAASVLLTFAVSYVFRVVNPVDSTETAQFFLREHTHASIQDPFIEPVSFMSSSIDEEWFSQSMDEELP